MKTSQLLRVMVVAAAAIAATTVAAQTLYKLIDKNGKVTYSEKPPKDFTGKVIPMDIDPNRNTATLPKPTKEELPPPRRRANEEGKGSPPPGEKGVDSEERVTAARERLESARAALKDAQDNPGPEDIARVGKVGGGARPVPSESYAKRLADLEKRVNEAEDALKRAEDAR